MKTPDREYVLEITSPADMWIRRCGNSPTGYLVSRISLRTVLVTSSDVHLDDKGWIRWRSGSLSFSAEPVLPESPGSPT